MNVLKCMFNHHWDIKLEETEELSEHYCYRFCSKCFRVEKYLGKFLIFDIWKKVSL